MRTRQNVIHNHNIDTAIPALPAGWWNSRNRRTVLLGMPFGIIGAFLLATNYDSIANPLSTGLQLSAQKSDSPAKIAPAKREPIEGSDLMRLTLTPKAAERLGIQMAPLAEAEVALNSAASAPADPASVDGPSGSLMRTSAEGSGTMRKVVPYSALLYDTHGKTWVYKSPEPLTFVRHQVTVDYIEGDVVVLSDGPVTGTSVVTVGGAQLYGTEFGAGH